MEKITQQLCKSCNYYAYTSKCCDYAEMTGKLRTINNHKVSVPKGYCDKYKKLEDKGNARAVEKRANWIRVNGGR